MRVEEWEEREAEASTMQAHWYLTSSLGVTAKCPCAPPRGLWCACSLRRRSTEAARRTIRACEGPSAQLLCVMLLVQSVVHVVEGNMKAYRY